MRLVSRDDVDPSTPRGACLRMFSAKLAPWRLRPEEPPSCQNQERALESAWQAVGLSPSECLISLAKLRPRGGCIAKRSNWLAPLWTTAQCQSDARVGRNLNVFSSSISGKSRQSGLCPPRIFTREPLLVQSSPRYRALLHPGCVQSSFSTQALRRLAECADKGATHAFAIGEARFLYDLVH